MSKKTETCFMNFGQNLINSHGYGKIILLCVLHNICGKKEKNYPDLSCNPVKKKKEYVRRAFNIYPVKKRKEYIRRDLQDLQDFLRFILFYPVILSTN